MKAIVYQKYGTPDVLSLRDVDQPVVGADEILVRVHAASLNALAWHYNRRTAATLPVEPAAQVFRYLHEARHLWLYVGAILSVKSGQHLLGTVLGLMALSCAMINVMGGFMVTDRMLSMFGTKKKKKKQPQQQP